MRGAARVLTLVGSGLALGAAACRRGPAGSPAPDEAPADALATAAMTAADSAVVARVENHNFLDVVLWLSRDGQRTRLGQVSSSATREFAIPARVFRAGGDVRLQAVAIGTRGELAGANLGRANSVTTDRLVLRPGQLVLWTLESDLRRSNYAVVDRPAP